MKIARCKPYQARLVECRRLAMPDAKSVFKVYFLSIVGRDDPARYEWEHAALTPDAMAPALAASGVEGIGFVTAFPHITKVFRFAPAAETLLHVKALATVGLSPMDLARDDNFVEFACYAEAIIAAEEYDAWARADSVSDYLEFVSGRRDAPVANPAKLAAYWTQACTS